VNVIAIGNGDSVLGNNFGSKIDSFDIILRINNFQISGYEEKVGTKTTHWARSDSKQIVLRNHCEFEKVLFCLPLRNFNVKSRMDYVLSMITSNTEIVDKKLVMKAQSLLPKHCWPSTGLISLMWLIDKYKKVTVYGFDCFKKIGGFARHYYDNREKMKKVIGHTTESEKTFIDFYRKRGNIISLEDL
jgi:hypothetical protein